jgi:putative two-component system hydrogenase maturation factor HypX/HoxX
VNVGEAVRIGLVDDALAGPPAAFEEAVLEYATTLATRADYPSLVESKRAVRAADEHRRPLAAYRAEELALMHRDIFDDRRGFAVLRHAFVTKRTRSSSRGALPLSSPVSPRPTAA